MSAHGTPEDRHIGRAIAATQMLQWKQVAEGFCEQVGIDPLDLEDMSDSELLPLIEEAGWCRDVIIDDEPFLKQLPREQADAFLDALGFERWFAENMRRGMREEEPLSHEMLVGGVVPDYSDPDNPVVFAAVTKLGDPQAIADKLVATCVDVFGSQATKSVAQHLRYGREPSFTAEQMTAMHDRGMSYREIAIQSLRDQIPDILEDPDAHRPAIQLERERIVKVIRAARRLWNNRLPSDSIG